MGCVPSTASSSDAVKKYALPNEDLLVRKANQAMGKEKEYMIKLLLLGAGGSGKTTFRKQLRNIYTGYRDQDRKETAFLIIDNLYDAARLLIQEARDRNLGEYFDTSTDLGKAVEELAKPREEVGGLTADHANKLNLLWAHPATKAMVKDRQKFHLQECALSYFEQLPLYPVWGGPGWLPSVDDCIRARIRSSGVVEEPIQIDGVTFMIFDAGGQRSERRKWIHYFDRVNAIMFVTSLTAYAENLFEDENQNNQVESLALFENLANSKWFSSTPILLFMNKRDLFEKMFVEDKIGLNCSGYFPEAPDTTDPNVAIKYIIDLYIGRKRLNPNRPNDTIANLLYPHVTTAVDKNNIHKVFDTCKTIILKQALASTGFSF